MLLVTEDVLENALKFGHSTWVAQVNGWDEEFYLRLEKASLNSDKYCLVFATKERNAWDVAYGNTAKELYAGINNYFPQGIKIARVKQTKRY